ncbi:hypothetical protein [Thiohalocapsa sp. ML1]|jgi:hypothetical protein|uniref:hypothetical protein n=1 Tax=Thiohalocapsa sp. ML1 TaxID=1431688 RepID=UPI000731F2B8|nr:hypothetical protein [Thiohalocapsa sp. ML1]
MDSTIETIKRELPRLLREDPALRDYVLELTRGFYAGRAETDDCFDRVLNELARDREAQAHKWDEQNREWDEQHLALKECEPPEHGLVLRDLAYLVPTHCTGDAARAAFRQAYGERCCAGGAGRKILLRQRADAD